MMLEPPFNLPFAAADRKVGDPPRWRHMKNACGENIRRVYHQTRMDLAVSPHPAACEMTVSADQKNRSGISELPSMKRAR